jgi:L-malate glycosyltransferase
MARLRICLIVPRPETRTGPAVSAARIMRLVDPEEYSITIHDADSDEPIPACDIVHAYDAWRAGQRAPEGMPLVVSLAGEDVMIDYHVASRREVIERVLGQARVVLTHNPAFQAIAPHARQMPASIDLTQELWDARKAWNVPRRAPLFLVPGGIRPAKRNHLALELLTAMPEAYVVLAGPVLDPLYASEFLHKLAHVVLPRERMWGAYASADVVVNLSQAEGLSNAVAEAMWVGRPILASDISGNRHALDDAGLYFGDAEQLRTEAVRMMASPDLRRTLSRRAQARARKIFSAADEKRAIEKAYSDAAR